MRDELPKVKGFCLILGSDFVDTLFATRYNGNIKKQEKGEFKCCIRIKHKTAVSHTL